MFFITFHSKLDKKTPFPFIDSKVIFDCSTRDSEVRNKIFISLYKALKDKSVKYFIVENSQLERVTGKPYIKESLDKDFEKSFAIKWFKIYKRKQ